VSRPAGSRNDARLVEPGKLLCRYIRPKGECTAERYVYDRASTYILAVYVCACVRARACVCVCVCVWEYAAPCRKPDRDIRRLYVQGVPELQILRAVRLCYPIILFKYPSFRDFASALARLTKRSHWISSGAYNAMFALDFNEP